MDNLVKRLTRSVALCLATGIMLTSCGGSDTQSSPGGAKLLANGEACAAAWSFTNKFITALGL